MWGKVLKLQLFIQTVRLFTRREQWVLLLLLVLNIVSAVLEIIGIGAVIPFVMLLAKPESLQQNHYLSLLYQWSGAESNFSFILRFGIAVIILFIGKNLFVLWVFAWRQQFMRRKYERMVSALYSAYIYSPYRTFFVLSGPEMLRNIQAVQLVLHRLMTPLFNLVTEGVTVMGMIVFLLIVAPLTSFMLIAVLGIASLLFLALLKRKGQQLGEQYLAAENQLISNVTQSLGSIKETRLLQKEGYFQRRVSSAADHLGKVNVWLDVLAVAPRFFIESLSVMMLLFTIIGMLYWQRDPVTVMISVSLLGMGAVRLIPSITRISTSINGIRIYLPAFNLIYGDILAVMKGELAPKYLTGSGKLSFKKSLAITNVSFRYNAECLALDNVSLTIYPGQSIGIVGVSGSGKSTLIDLILGLLEPDSGSIETDGQRIAQNLPRWYSKIGYVPQKIFIFNDTIRHNIALGIDDNEIEPAQMEHAIAIAQLKPLLARLKYGLDEPVGDSGIKLSGGERQRIGIARALYHNPDIIVLDEATAALDNITERELANALRQDQSGKTLIAVAHRLSTVRNYDVIVMMEQGRIVACGSYDELLRDSPQFLRLTGEDND